MSTDWARSDNQPTRAHSDGRGCGHGHAGHGTRYSLGTQSTVSSGDFVGQQDTELLLGRLLPGEAFNDTTVGRAMEEIFAAGAVNVFSEVSFQACRRFELDMSNIHFDTTSVNVWGDYDVCEKNPDGLLITEGYSKDKRPDLKQFLISMLCVERNIPILGGCENGNTSDKTINNDILTSISRHLAKHGLASGAFLYIADAAMVTADNLKVVGDNAFVTHLLFSYNETDRVVADAVAADCLLPVGTLNETPVTAKRPAAFYSVAEKTVTLYGRDCRAIVVHSSAQENRRLTRIDRNIGKSEVALGKLLVKEAKISYFCRADAEAAAAQLQESGTPFHSIKTSLIERIRYTRGRPPKNGPRKAASVRYGIEASLCQNTEQLHRMRQEAGCFVLLSNVPLEVPHAMTGVELLRLTPHSTRSHQQMSLLIVQVQQESER